MSVHQNSNGNGVTIVKFATSKNLFVTYKMFPHGNSHNYTWTFLMGRLSQINQILIDRKCHSFILDAGSFSRGDCHTDHCLLVAKVRERLQQANKQHRSLKGKDSISGS